MAGKKNPVASRPQKPLAQKLLATIQQHALETLASTLPAAARVSIDPTPYRKGLTFQLPEQRITVPAAAVLVFVDDLPGANWGHPCRYRFHHPETGELLSEQRALFPPTVHDPAIRLITIHGPGDAPQPPPRKVVGRVDWRKLFHVPVLPFIEPRRRYAVLFTGKISNTRHVADLEFLWRTLVDVYGFAAADVYVLCYDGTVASVDGALTKWAGDNTNYRMSVWRAATKVNLQAAFDDLANRIGADDLLLVHTNNHGSPSGLCLDNVAVLAPADFGTMLAGLPAFGSLVVMMEQCYSGAFKDTVLDKSTASRTVFTSAAPADEVSWGGWPFDAFAGVWIEALAGAHADGSALAADPDVNNNGRVSMKEAFDYANTNDTSGDHPVYADAPAGCGANVWLGQVNLLDLLPHLEWYLEQLRVHRIPLPDPPPDLPASDPAAARAQVLRQRLIGLAKALGPVPGRA